MKNQKGFGAIEALLLLVIVGIIGGVGYYVYNANKEEVKISDSSIQQKDSNAEQKAEGSTPGLIDYGEDNPVALKVKSDVSKLEGASDSFKDFMSSQLSDKLEKCSTLIAVWKILDDKFASGYIHANGEASECGGGAKGVWIKENGKWFHAENLEGQTYSLCSEVNKYKVPKEIIEECQDDSKPASDEAYPLIKNPN